jgi:uncharacterized protein YlaN (UPF0358 family)
MMTEEDEAFNEIERQAKQRMEMVRAQVQLSKVPHDPMYDVVWDSAIEMVATRIEQMKGFGQDTISSLAIYIRSLKK